MGNKKREGSSHRVECIIWTTETEKQKKNAGLKEKNRLMIINNETTQTLGPGYWWHAYFGQKNKSREKREQKNKTNQNKIKQPT